MPVTTAPAVLTVVVALASLALAACGGDERPTPSNDAPVAGTPAAAVGGAGVCGPAPITGGGIGALRIGLPVDSLRALCRVVRDTTRAGPEGLPVRVATVALDGDTVRAEIVDDRVWRVAVATPGLRTADSLGVGTPLARLLEVSDVQGAWGEGALYVQRPDHCGLSFRLAAPAAKLAGAEVTAGALRALPAATVVDEVLIVGCR